MTAPNLTPEQHQFLKDNPEIFRRVRVCLKLHGEQMAIALLENHIDPNRKAALKPGKRKEPPKGRPIDQAKRQRVRDAIAQLETIGAPFNHRQVCRLAGVCSTYLMQDCSADLRRLANDAIARVKAKLSNVVQLETAEELRCLRAIEALETEGEYFNLHAVTKRAGLSNAYFRRNRKMRQLAEAAIDRTLTRLHQQSWEVS